MSTATQPPQPPPVPAAQGPGAGSREGGPVAMNKVADRVLALWAHEAEFTPATLAKCGDLVRRFIRRLEAQGVTDPQWITTEHCHGFVTAHTSTAQPPEITTMHARRSALRMLFRTMRDQGWIGGDPTLDLQLPARTATAARPLSDEEVTLCRASSRMGEAGGAGLYRAVCWALGEATAVTSEISAIRVGDVDDPEHPRWVRLPGTRRHDPRLGELSEWGSVIIARQLHLLIQQRRGPASPLVYRGKATPGEPTAQSAVCNAIAGVLKNAGLHYEPDVRPASLRNWAGRRLYLDGMPIEQVARRMGTRSLDAAAADIALGWRET